MTEVNAVLRLTMSRLGTHPCPNGHPVRPSLDSWATEQLTCGVCGATAPLPSAESFAFNTLGACPTCHGLGVTKEVDTARLVVDEDLTLEDGAIGPWRMLGRSHMPLVAAELGVRTDVPWRELTDDERRMVIEGPWEPVKKHIVGRSGAGRPFPLNAAYESATDSVTKMAANVTDSGRTGAERYLVTRTCPTCGGSRLSPEARRSRLAGQDLAQILALPLRELPAFASDVVAEADSISSSLTPHGGAAHGRAAQGCRAAAGAGADLPVGAPGRGDALHGPVGDGNSFVVVDHDIQILAAADELVELGPGAGADGGRLVAQGPPEEVRHLPESLIGPYLTGSARLVVRERRPPDPDLGAVEVGVSRLFNLRDVEARLPLNRLTAVTGVSGAGKTALILDSLVPAMRAERRGDERPAHVRNLGRTGLERMVVVDATPIGANDRSTPATYSGAFDEIRGLFATTEVARERGWDKGRFSYNTPRRAVPGVRRTGRARAGPAVPARPARAVPGVPRCQVQPRDARGGRRRQVDRRRARNDGCRGEGVVRRARGRRPCPEGGPDASAAPARWASRRRPCRVEGRSGCGSRRSCGAATLVGVLDRLVQRGATVVVVEHDLDLVANCDWVVDIRADPASVIGPWLDRHLAG